MEPTLSLGLAERIGEIRSVSPGILSIYGRYFLRGIGRGW